MRSKTEFSKAKVERLLDDLEQLGFLTNVGYHSIAERRSVRVRKLNLPKLPLASDSQQQPASDSSSLPQIREPLASDSQQLASDSQQLASDSYSEYETSREYEAQPSGSDRPSGPPKKTVLPTEERTEGKSFSRQEASPLATPKSAQQHLDAIEKKYLGVIGAFSHKSRETVLALLDTEGVTVIARAFADAVAVGQLQDAVSKSAVVVSRLPEQIAVRKQKKADAAAAVEHEKRNNDYADLQVDASIITDTYGRLKRRLCLDLLSTADRELIEPFRDMHIDTEPLARFEAGTTPEQRKHMKAALREALAKAEAQELADTVEMFGDLNKSPEEYLN